MAKTGTNTFDFKRENLLLLNLQHVRALELPAAAAAELRVEVDAAKQAGPFTVVREKRVAPSGDVHDYTSIAPYAWPDPDQADGLPWIIRDGEVNPERDHCDNVPLFAWCWNCRTLALGAHFLNDKEALDHLAFLLRTWILDPATRMNPHLRYTQCVPGARDGNCWGLIDTNLLPGVLDAVSLVLDRLPEDLRTNLQQWIGDLAQWFLDSELGKEEAAMPNNHGTWYLVQVVAYSSFAGEHQRARSLLRDHASKLITSQVQADGSQPHELARTLSFSYTTFNLMAFTCLSMQALRYELELGAEFDQSLLAAARFLLPLAEGAAWQYEQIKPLNPTRLIPLFANIGGLVEDELLQGKAENWLWQRSGADIALR